MDKRMTLLKPLKNTSLLIPYEQFFIHSLHKEGKLISEQNPGEPKPILQLPMTFPTPHMIKLVQKQPVHSAYDLPPVVPKFLPAP